MPSSLLPSRSARSSVSISPSSLFFISSRRSLVVARNFLRLAALLELAAFLGIGEPRYLDARDNRRGQVVCHRPIDTRPYELAGGGVAVEKNRAVDFRRLAREPADRTGGAVRSGPLDQHLELAAYQRAILAHRNLRLRLHQLGAPLAHHAIGHLVRKIAGRGAL